MIVRTFARYASLGLHDKMKYMLLVKRFLSLGILSSLAATGCLESSESTSTEPERADNDALSAPAFADLRPLPGGGTGSPILVSNNPEIFTGTGLLGGTLMPSAGGRTLSNNAFQAGCPAGSMRDFSIYLFHINKTGLQKRVFVLLSPAGSAPVTLDAQGSLNANQWTLGQSSSFKTSSDLVSGLPIQKSGVTLPAGKVFSLASVDVGNGNPVDGRFHVSTQGGCVFARVVAASAGADATAALVAGSQSFAPGEIHTPDANHLGRVSGVYAHDGWTGSDEIAFSTPRAMVGYRFDERIQGAPAIGYLTDSDDHSTGNYGSIYDLSLKLTNTTSQCLTLRAVFDSYPGEQNPADVDSGPTRFWDGMSLINKAPVRIQTVPGAMESQIAKGNFAPGQTSTWSFHIPVPGLITIPEGLILQAFPCGEPNP